MSRARENADGARLDAPLASPAFTGTPTGITGTHITSGTLGNTVQDNITRLGTVTAGNLSNTAIVYPAGHQINHWQIVRVMGSTQYSDTIDGTPTIINLNGALTITGVSATENNYLRVTAGGFSWRVTGDNTYATYLDVFDGSASLSEYSYYYDSQTTDNITPPITLTFMITVPASFTSKSVSVRAWEQAGSTSTSNIVYGHVNMKPFLTIDEIQA